MATEKFDCENCGGHGKVAFKQDDSKFTYEVTFCPFCGGDLELEIDEIEVEDVYEE